MYLGSLRTLTMAAFKLAIQGTADEDLFGIVACLLCLMNNGADPYCKFKFSLSVLFDGDPVLHCSHEEHDMLDLANYVTSRLS